MTHTELLSTRIAALEQQAANLPELHALRQTITQEIARQQSQLAFIHERIDEAQQAESILSCLNEQAERLLTAGDLMRGDVQAVLTPSAPAQQPDLPEPYEQPDQLNSSSIQADPSSDVPPERLPASPETREITLSTPQTAPAEAQPDQPPQPTNRERLAQWVATLEPDAVFTTQHANLGAGVPLTSTASILSQMVKLGQIERIPGTGVPGIPSQFRLPGSAATSQLQPEEPAQQPADAQATELAATIAEERPSGKARLLAFLNGHPEESFHTAQLQAEVDLSRKGVAAYIKELLQAELAHAVPGTWPIEYRAGVLQAPSNALASPLTPIPDRLSVDERELFDALRREPEGLSERLLTHRLNWMSSRTARAVATLVSMGHIGRNGDRLRVIPPELQGDGAA